MRSAHPHEGNRYEDALYRRGTGHGEGRDGHGRTSDGKLDLDLATPPNWAAAETAPIPSSSSRSATQHASTRRCGSSRVRRRPTSRILQWDPEFHSDRLDNGGFGLAVELEISLPNLDHDSAQRLTEKAHQVCPYSNATRGNIDVTLTVVDD